MRIEELRIGNLVYNNSTQKDIKKVTKIGFKIIEFEKGLFSFSDEVKPIPLTEEILFKCGFVKCSFIDNHYNVLGVVIWNCNDMFICNKNGVNIKYLHQLQNLYFALTNQELNIEL